MTSLERVLRVLRFATPDARASRRAQGFRAALPRADRVPYFEQGVASKVASAILGREAHTGGGGFRRLGVEAAIKGPDAHREYVETFFLSWCDLVEALDFDVVTVPWAGGGTPTKKLDDCTYLFGNLDGAWTVMRYDPGSDTFYTVDSSLRHEKALREIEVCVEEMEARRREGCKPIPAFYPLEARFVERFGRTRAIGAGPCLVIPMEPAWWEAMMVIPETVARYVELQTEWACDEIDVLASMGIHLIWGGGDLATNLGPVYSPEQFRRFMLEPLKRMTARCRAHGVPYFFRTDGVIWPIAQELYVDSGVDGYGEIDKQAGMEIAEIRRRLPHLLLWGNVDCGQTLTLGTPEDVAAETRACIDAARLGGGHLLGSSNVIHAGVPPENFLAMIETCRTYGRH